MTGWWVLVDGCRRTAVMLWYYGLRRRKGASLFWERCRFGICGKFSDSQEFRREPHTITHIPRTKQEPTCQSSEGVFAQWWSYPVQSSAISSRICFILIDTGNEWLLITDNDNDDGDWKWQTHNWKSIPCAVAKQLNLNNCRDKGREAKCVDFCPTGAWYVYGVKPDGSASAGYSCWWGGTLNGKVSFGSNLELESYVILKGRNGYSLRNIHQSLQSHIHMKQMNGENKMINFVWLFENGKFFISDDQQSQKPDQRCKRWDRSWDVTKRKSSRKLIIT